MELVGRGAVASAARIAEKRALRVQSRLATMRRSRRVNRPSRAGIRQLLQQHRPVLGVVDLA